jgi:hypothetical protein
MIDVLVVGAGPVGLTLAIDFARRGIACRVIEQSPTYQIGTRGRGISMRSQEVFEDLGILEALFPYDESMGPVHTYDHDKLVSESNPGSLFPTVPPPYRPILMLNQQHTEAVLRKRLASYGLNVELGCQLLDTYQAERLPVAMGVLASTSKRHREFAQDFGKTVTNLVAGKETFADVTQLSITYRGGPLARDLDDTTGIRAGDRAPDAHCVRAENGEQVRLFDVFQGTHFTLLAFGEQPIPELPDVYADCLNAYTVIRSHSTTVASERTLIDSDEQAYRAYGITEDALILVRPDGYIGLTGGSLSQEPIIDYLRNVTGR